MTEIRTRDAAAWWRPTVGGPDLLEMSLGEMLDRQAARFPDRPAVTVDEGGGARRTAWTYADLRAEADAAARGLMAQGVEPGDHVGMMAQNCAEWIVMEYAVAKVGAVLVTINPALVTAELEYVLRQGKVELLVFAPAFRKNDIAGSLVSLMPDLDGSVGGRRTGGEHLPDLGRLIAIGPETPPFAMAYRALRDAAADVGTDALSRRQSGVAATDVAQIQYTSGTTGKPKGAMLTHRSTVNNARLMADRGGYAETDVMLSAMPLFHTAGCVCNVMAMLACGGHLVTMDAFEPRRMLELWDDAAPTLLNAVPTMMTRMLEHPDRSRFEIRTLRKVITGGTSIPPSLMHRMKEETGGDPLIIMGMTECSPIIAQTDPRDDFETRIATAGTPLPHTELRIENPQSGETCDWGKSGELCIRGYLTMAGYFDMPKKTAETVDADGWLHSGDLAELSRTGHLRIVGRLKDMLIRGGENVYPAEIEECLLNHPSVSEAQVVGVPDADLGEEICAFVIAAPGKTADPVALRRFCAERMARHKVPRYIAPADAFPLTANGKVQKYELRTMAVSGLEDGTITEVPR